MRAGAVGALKEELLTLKYLGSRSPFMRKMARSHAKGLPNGAAMLAASKLAARKVKARASKMVRKLAKKR